MDAAEPKDDFELLEPLLASRARFRFDGVFKGRHVAWLCDLRRMKDTEDKVQSIAIEQCSETEFTVIVVLDIDAINRAELLKTMIMIRKYRSLSLGKHQWSSLNSDE